MSNNDQTLIKAYLDLQISVVRILAFLPKRQVFLELLADSHSPTVPYDDLIWRLLQLRKSGKLPPLKKGGR